MQATRGPGPQGWGTSAAARPAPAWPEDPAGGRSRKGWPSRVPVMAYQERHRPKTGPPLADPFGGCAAMPVQERRWPLRSGRGLPRSSSGWPLAATIHAGEAEGRGAQPLGCRVGSAAGAGEGPKGRRSRRGEAPRGGAVWLSGRLVPSEARPNYRVINTGKAF